MQSKWQKTTLGEFVNINPRRSVKKGTVTPFVGMPDITENIRDIRVIGEREFGSGMKFQDGDTLFARITPCLENGKTVLVNGLGEGVIAHGSTEFIVLSPKDIEHDAKFIYYLARLPEFREFARSRMEGTSGRQRVDATALASYEFMLPPPDIRKGIGEALSAFDDKMIANSQMNQTLEKIAQRIFKSWFIDFDPVKANAEGVPFNGLSPEIQALFPNKLVDSKTEFGLIPEGWNPSSIGVEFDVTMGQSPPGSSYNEEQVGVKFFQGRRDFGFRFPSDRVYTTEPKRMAKSDDTLISVRAPVGDINMAMDDCCIGRGLGAFRHKKDLTSYTYYLMQSIRPVFDKYESNGTVFGSINQNELKAIRYITPDIKVLEEFEKVVGSLDKKIRANVLQNLNLTSVKEKILSRLMTGKIPLSKAI